MKILGDLWKLFDTDSKLKFVLLVGIIIAGSLIDTLALSVMSPFIALLMKPTVIETDSNINFIYNLLGLDSQASFLAIISFLLAFIYILRGIYLFFQNRLQYKFVSNRRFAFSSQLIKKFIENPYVFHLNKNSSELQNSILSDVYKLSSVINTLLSFISDLFMSLFIVIFLFFVSVTMTITVMGFSGICVMAFFLVYRKKIELVGNKSRNSNIELYKVTQQALGSIKDLKVHHKEEFFIKEFEDACAKNVGSEQSFQIISSLPRLFIESICFGGTFIIISLMIISGTDVAAIVPQLSVFVLAAFRLLPTVSRFTSYVSAIIMYQSSISYIYKNLQSDSDIYETFSRTNVTVPAKSKDIIIQNISYSYPNNKKIILNDISISIPQNSSVAFIGSSGAGKTTLVDVVLGILRPSSGGVFYNGKNIHTDWAEWSTAVGYIPQQIYLLDESIRKNIAFGIHHTEINEQMVLNALEQSQLLNFINSLPEGLDTIVGERGVRLSGGQRQRIGIARALYHDPQVLVLDEATSSLDNETEKAVMEAIKTLQGQKTLIIVAHRLSTIEHCDMIFKVSDGKVARER